MSDLDLQPSPDIRRRARNLATNGMRLFVFLAASATWSVDVSAGETDSALSNGDILVSRSDVEGASYPSVRVEGVVDAPPEAVWKVICNCARSQHVNSSIKKSYVVARSTTDLVCSELIDLPWPLRNLESVTRWTFQVSEQRWKKRWSLVRGDFDYANGSWTLTPFGDGTRTRAVYENHFSPQIFVPDWLARAFLTVGLPGLIKDLRAALPHQNSPGR